ncbi:PREDICTED: uncharacterized protein LOC109128663 [Camelina sativa]|uniref:Uncharacterized protein LOC109128663 n=1 Tax=Camelina sativa TaxID=90675 RepID=A0ABM1QW94_CAMSA|nr:PREDICTED: uncharacterized protein LOC109128663 [Camelina sativa]
MLIKKWCKAMQKEIDALEANQTWDVTDLPPSRKKAISSKWVYKLKFNSDGTLETHKARLVVMGNHQKEGTNFKETFALVAKMTIAPRYWFSKLSTALRELGFTQSYQDYSLFSLRQGELILHVLVYVDDFVVNDLHAINEFKLQLNKCFHMKDLGKLKYFLGIEVSRGPDGFCLSQRKYALDIITEVGLLGAKPSLVPIEQNQKLAYVKGPAFDNPEQYRRLVGRFIYLTITRPDLSYAVHILSQFMKAPLVAHWEATLRLVRYLKGSPTLGIFLRSDSELHSSAYCDSDYKACPRTCWFLSAYIVYLGDSPISWKTKKQKTVSSSSAEVEYRAMAYTLKEIKWLKALMRTLGVDHPQPIDLHCDNQATTYIAANHAKLIATQHISTSDQVADLLTKALPGSTIARLMSTLGVGHYVPPT